MRRGTTAVLVGVVGISAGAETAIAVESPAFSSGKYQGKLTAPVDKPSGGVTRTKFPLTFRIHNGDVVKFRATFTCEANLPDGTMAWQRHTDLLQPMRIGPHGRFADHEYDNYYGGGLIVVTGRVQGRHASGSLSYDYYPESDHAETCGTLNDEPWSAQH